MEGSLKLDLGRGEREREGGEGRGGEGGGRERGWRGRWLLETPTTTHEYLCSQICNISVKFAVNITCDRGANIPAVRGRGRGGGRYSHNTSSVQEAVDRVRTSVFARPASQ